jgi:hypothetical protein
MKALNSLKSCISDTFTLKYKTRTIFLGTFVPLFLLYIIFYFTIKEHKTEIASLKSGEKLHSQLNVILILLTLIYLTELFCPVACFIWFLDIDPSFKAMGVFLMFLILVANFVLSQIYWALSKIKKPDKEPEN